MRFLWAEVKNFFLYRIGVKFFCCANCDKKISLKQAQHSLFCVDCQSEFLGRLGKLDKLKGV